MAVYENAYEILRNACDEFCHDNFGYDDIVAEIYTDVLGRDFVFCTLVDGTFEFITDWYEGGHLEIVCLDYFTNVCYRGFHNKEV